MVAGVKEKGSGEPCDRRCSSPRALNAGPRAAAHHPRATVVIGVIIATTFLFFFASPTLCAAVSLEH